MSRTRRDDGMMLVELIVGMSLTAVVGVMVTTALVNAFHSQKQLQDRGDALAAVRQTAQRVTRDLREANPVLVATPSSLAIRENTTTGTVSKTWSLVATGTTASLVQDTQPTSAAGVVGPTVRTTVITGLVGSTAPFSYDHIPGWTAPTGSTVDPTTCAVAGTTPTSYARECIGTISLHLLRTVPGRAPVALDTTVDLRNTGS